MAWGGFILTNAGRNLLAKVQAGTIAGLNITRFGIGDGTYAGSYSTITNLVSQKQSVPLRTKKAKDQFTNIDGYFSNEGLLTGFYFKEWGIFAMDGLQEILYAYDNAGDDAEYIAPDGNVRYEKMLKAALSISANIAVTINTSGVIYATTDDIVSNIELHDSNEEAHPDIRQKLGDITTLTTVDKTSAVAAINELRELNNNLDDLKVTPHLAKLVTDIDGVHGIKIESGIFTPALCASTTAGTHAYTIQTGRYNKIGKQVLATLDVNLTKDATMSGIIQINGLPFISRAGPRYAINLLYFIGINMPTSTQLTGYVEAGTGNIVFYYQKSDGTNSQISSDKILSNFAIGITVMYETN